MHLLQVLHLLQSGSAMKKGKPESLREYLETHDVFTLDEVRAAYRRMGRSADGARDALAYHLKTGELVSVRRGLYVKVDADVDPHVVASRLADDAVLAWGGALSAHGVLGVGHGIQLATRRWLGDGARFKDIVFTAMKPSPGMDRALCEVKFGNVTVRATTLERALVDCLDRVEKLRGLKVMWNVFRALPPDLEWKKVLEAHEALGGSRLLASKLGVFFTAWRGAPEALKATLQERALTEADYFFRGEAPPRSELEEELDHRQRVMARWRLIAPEPLVRLWEKSMGIA